MGCATSKRLESSVADDVYHPPPTSISLFDITKIDEPWLLSAVDEKPPKPAPLIPLSLLDKLDSFELAPKPWSEVSKSLEDLKPTLHHTPASPPRPPPPELAALRPVKENSFVLRDRLERQGTKDLLRWKRPNPLEGYPERRPPGNCESVVLYTTTLRGVRRTFDDCERVRGLVEGCAAEAGLEVDERDVSLHGEYLKEVRGMVGEAVVPRLFVAGRYVGGAREAVELAESGKLGEMMRWVWRRVGGEKGKGGRRSCEGCGGARFVPCAECNGSCKVVGEDGKKVVVCGLCNENGLALCPMCH